MLMRGMGSEELAILQPDLGAFGHKLFVQLLELTSNDENYEYTLKRCRDRNKLFVDDNFPPSQGSLLFPLSSPQTKEKARKWEGYLWKRCTEIFDISKIQIFQGNREQ